MTIPVLPAAVISSWPVNGYPSPELCRLIDVLTITSPPRRGLEIRNDVSTVTNMTITVTENGGTVPASVTVETSFRISSPRLGGDVIVSTSIDLQSSGEGYPFTGQLEITAAGNTGIVIIALDADTARLEIDINGDGSPDEVIDLTWVELLAAGDAA